MSLILALYAREEEVDIEVLVEMRPKINLFLRRLDRELVLQYPVSESDQHVRLILQDKLLVNEVGEPLARVLHCHILAVNVALGDTRFGHCLIVQFSVREVSW